MIKAAIGAASPRTMLGRPLRWFAAKAWERQIERNRRELYSGATGLRIVTLHQTTPSELEHLRHLVDWGRDHFDFASPEHVDDLVAGGRASKPRDQLLFTFDDGFASNYQAARLLADSGIRAIFFIVPSFVDRTVGEYLEYHARNGVSAFPLANDHDVRGLSRTEIADMMEMGHRIAAHNFAHRDLGQLHDSSSLRYEIDGALDAIAELTGAPCRDFAYAFGQPHNISEEAASRLADGSLTVYACHRGLNVPGRSPRFLLRHSHDPEHPLAFARSCLLGGADHRLHARATSLAERTGFLMARPEAD